MAPLLYDEAFVDDLMARSAERVCAALMHAGPVTQVAAGHAEVHEVACNRRVIGPDGKIKYTRTSATIDPAARADRKARSIRSSRSIAFQYDDRLLARLYYYTTHPMSYYGDGRVSSDFVGLAATSATSRSRASCTSTSPVRRGTSRRENITTGTMPTAPLLAERVHRGMVAARCRRTIVPRARPGRLEDGPPDLRPRPDLDLDKLKAQIGRCETNGRQPQPGGDGSPAGPPRVASDGRSCWPNWSLANLDVLHLPAETFVEYQLEAPAPQTRYFPCHRGLRRRRTMVHPPATVVRRGRLRAERRKRCAGNRAVVSPGARGFAAGVE